MLEPFARLSFQVARYVGSWPPISKAQQIKASAAGFTWASRAVWSQEYGIPPPLPEREGAWVKGEPLLTLVDETDGGRDARLVSQGDGGVAFAGDVFHQSSVSRTEGLCGAVLKADFKLT